MPKFRIELTEHECSGVFWVLFANYGDNWCNCGSGWARGFELAYKDAYNYYYLTYVKCIKRKI